MGNLPPESAVVSGALNLEGVRRFWKQLSAIDDNRLTRDISGLVAGQKEHSVAAILDRSEPLDRQRLSRSLQVCLAEGDDPLCCDGARLDRIDCYAKAGELDRRNLDEAVDAGLRGCVMRQPPRCLCAGR